MKVLFLEWNNFGNPDMIDAFERLEIRVVRAELKQGVQTKLDEAGRVIEPQLKLHEPEFVFSFNYIPNVSIVCQEHNIPYVSWVYDSPYIHVFSYTVLNPCNYIFLFDYDLYDKLSREGISTVYYLPLAVNEKRLKSLENTEYRRKRFGADISFVGSLYNEPKHRLFDRFQVIHPYAKGYLDAITKSQKLVYGYNFLEELLTPDIVEEMEKAYPTDPNALTVMKPEAIYADYVLSRHVTAMERDDIMRLLGQYFPERRICLYTNNQTDYAGIQNFGYADYYEDMPYVFLNSKINLNISLKSIKTGIPLRAFDIMGSGGFLLTNYQQELFEYFSPDEDFVYYNTYEDLMGKAEYYLSHEKERVEIMRSGTEKVLREHTMKMRAEEMIRRVFHSEQR